MRLIPQSYYTIKLSFANWLLQFDPRIITFADLECGLPAQVPNGEYLLVNGTKGYQSTVRYACQEGHIMVGRRDLVCDVDQKWDGPPPRCEPLVCPEPPPIVNGHYEILEENGNAYRVAYDCDEGYMLTGPQILTCVDGAYDQLPPGCREYRTSPNPDPTVPLPTPTTRRVPLVPIVTAPSTTPKPTTTSTTPKEEETYDEPNQYEDPIYGEEQPVPEVKQTLPPLPPFISTQPPPPKPVRPNSEVRNNGIDSDPPLNTEESINVNIIHKGKSQNADLPKNSIEVQTKVSAVSRLNLGRIHSFIHSFIHYQLNIGETTSANC